MAGRMSSSLRTTPAHWKNCSHSSPVEPGLNSGRRISQKLSGHECAAHFTGTNSAAGKNIAPIVSDFIPAGTRGTRTQQRKHAKIGRSKTGLHIVDLRIVWLHGVFHDAANGFRTRRLSALDDFRLSG